MSFPDAPEPIQPPASYELRRAKTDSQNSQNSQQTQNSKSSQNSQHSQHSQHPQGSQNSQNSHHDPFIQELQDSITRAEQRAAAMNSPDSIVVSKGRINSMVLPAGWAPGVVDKKGSADLFEEFHHPDTPSAVLAFYYRGRRLPNEVGRSFVEILERDPHVLSLKEIDSIKRVLRDKQDPADFSMMTARTEAIGGKKVLLVEGRYKESQQDTLEIFIDSDGTGTAVQEVFFQAPKDEYRKQMQAIRKSFATIEWK